MSGFKAEFTGNKRIDVSFGKFKIETDQSVKNGGDETAPEPFAVFLASLAACAGIYAKSFCDTRKLSTTGMYVSLDVSFKKGQKHMEEVHITLHVNRDFPEKYVKPVIKTMNGCAVKNQLNPDIQARTTVAYLD